MERLVVIHTRANSVEKQNFVSSSKCLRPMSGNRNQGFFGCLSPLVTAVHAPTFHNSSQAQPIRVSFQHDGGGPILRGLLRTADNRLRTAFQNSPAAEIPERLHSPAQRKRVISHTKVCPRERARSYIQPEPNVALESTRLCGHDQPVDSANFHDAHFSHPESLHKEAVAIGGPVFVRRRRVFPCPSVRWFSTSRKTLSSRSLLTWCTRTCLLRTSVSNLIDSKLLLQHIPLEIVRSRISVFALWTEWTNVAWAVVY